MKNRFKFMKGSGAKSVHPYCRQLSIRILWLLLFMVGGISMIWELGIPLTGNVIDADGTPLPVVSILEKETNNGAQIDSDRNFFNNIKNENTLLAVYFIGFHMVEIAEGAQKRISLSLEARASGLDEAVIVDIGSRNKSQLTAAVEQIGRELLVNRSVNKLSEAFQRAISGSYIAPINGGPASECNFNIPGFTRFGEVGQALVSIVGSDRKMIDVNPNNIESVNVLKDPPAPAIYGSKALSEVILITTKVGPFASTSDEPIIKVSPEPDKCDSFRVDKAVSFYLNGIYWFYPKGRGRAHGAGESAHTQMDITFSKDPEGPFTKLNKPILPENHEIVLWQQVRGVEALAFLSNTLEYAT